jgi:hypothetical protein
MIKSSSNVRKVIKDIQRFVNKSIPRAGKFGLRSLAERVQKRMQVPGKRIRYPIDWDSVRQMIAFFASNGFGKGIPYRRSNRYKDGWRLRELQNRMAFH